MLGTTLRLSQSEAQELQTRARSRVLRADDVRRARLILMLSEGQSWSTIHMPWAVVRLTSRVGRPALPSSVWLACLRAIRGGLRLSARRGWKPAFWPGPDA